MLDTVLIIFGGILVVTGTIGCILPILPGPPISYAGLLLLQVSSRHPFSMQFLIIVAVLVALAALLDYVIPIYGTKKFEGSSYGIWGSACGLALGLFFFPPLGILIGPIAGAFAGELIRGHKAGKALKSAVGSLLGFLTGTLLKLVLCFGMAYYYVIALF
jgi:uncharacterized protein YqgC (DUF456 family)